MSLEETIAAFRKLQWAVEYDNSKLQHMPEDEFRLLVARAIVALAESTSFKSPEE